MTDDNNNMRLSVLDQLSFEREQATNPGLTPEQFIEQRRINTAQLRARLDTEEAAVAAPVTQADLDGLRTQLEDMDASLHEMLMGIKEQLGEILLLLHRQQQQQSSRSSRLDHEGDLAMRGWNDWE